MLKSFLIILLIFFGIGLQAEDDFRVGVWVHAGMFPRGKAEAVAELDKKLTFFKSIGVENLYVFQALKNEHKKGWNFLKRLTKVAHQHQLKVHPVIMPGHKIRMEGRIRKNPQWRIKNQLGRSMPYLNLSHPGARRYITARVKRLLRYKIDGIHLDYIRFPYLKRKNPGDSMLSMLTRLLGTALGVTIPEVDYSITMDHHFSYDPETLDRFEEYRKRHSGGEAENALMVMRRWVKWNASNVTLLVTEIRKTIQKSARDIPLSAAILSNREFAFHSLGQDWSRWAREGIVDALCPMIYHNDPQWFTRRLRGVLEAVNGKSRVYAGIAIRSSVNENTPEGVREQIRIAKSEGADGVVFFSGQALTHEFGNAIRESLSLGKACH